MTSILQWGSSALAVMFLFAALAKTDAWDTWARTASAIVPGSVVRPVVRVGVPAIEFLVAVLLLTAPRAGLPAAFATLLGLTFGAGWLGHTHPGVECSCFGTISGGTLGTRLTFRNAILSAAAGALVLGMRQAGVQAPAMQQVLFALLAGTTAVLLVSARRLRASRGMRTI